MNFPSRLSLDSLKDTIQEKYERILMYYGRDIDTIQKIYQRHRNDPPVAWDLPPIAGKIAWARQMYRRIQEPMEMFQKYPTILQTADAKKIIKNYNKLAKVLLEFEVLYHQAWLKQVWNTDRYYDVTIEEFVPRRCFSHKERPPFPDRAPSVSLKPPFLE